MCTLFFLHESEECVISQTCFSETIHGGLSWLFQSLKSRWRCINVSRHGCELVVEPKCYQNQMSVFLNENVFCYQTVCTNRKPRAVSASVSPNFFILHHRHNLFLHTKEIWLFARDNSTQSRERVRSRSHTSVLNTKCFEWAKCVHAEKHAVSERHIGHIRNQTKTIRQRVGALADVHICCTFFSSGCVVG